ncbi:hypothetical protein [uncultured Polaribacter sp.]|uniref:hypothetical protein n=1 Tax=uncultured Polaribacter sp. TaxID=174711 RepID=UPI00261DA487|nr:hypothetical protein [uncultured Polaribacter sp.]
MHKRNQILLLQNKQKKLKADIKKIKKGIPIYLLGIVFLMFLAVFGLESIVYTFFGGTVNFIVISSLITLALCGFYFYKSQNKIKYKEKTAKAIGVKIYSLMKLKNE